MKTRIVQFAGACAVSLATFGEALAYDHTLTSNASYQKTFATQPWNPTIEDGEDITTKAFLVPAGKMWQTPSLETITAQSVTIGEVGKSSASYWSYYGATYTKLILANGVLYPHMSNATIGGVVEVTAPASAPFRIRSNGERNVGYTFSGAVLSSADAGLLVYSVVNDNNYAHYVKFTSDTSQYLGSIVVTSAYNTAGQPIVATLEFNNTAFGGSVTLKADAQLKADQAMTIKSLTMETSSTLAEVAGSCVTVDGVSVDGPVKLSLTGAGTMPSEVTTYDVLTMPVDADVALDDFVVTSTSIRNAGFLSMVTNDLKTLKTLRVSYYPSVTLQKETASPHPTATSPTVSTFEDGSYWSDGEPVHAEAHYVASKISGTTYFAGTYSESDDELTFPGATLSVGDYVFFDLQAKKYYVPKMQFTGSAGIRSTAARERTLRSDQILIDGTLRAIGQSTSTLTLDAPIAGDEDSLINLYTTKGSTQDCRSEYVLKGDNSGYLGRVRLGVSQSDSDDASDDWRVCVLRLLAANNLGGARSAFTYNALKIGQRATLQAEADVTLDTVNRGIYVYGRSQFNVSEGKTLDIREQLTLSTNGTYSILKKGAGTLALGGDLRWLVDGEPSATKPEDVTSVLEVVAGTLRATAARALDGLDIIFTNDTTKIAVGITVDASATDSELKTYGFINLKTSAPLVASAKTGTVPVAFENLPENPKDAFSVPVCTVRETAAAGVLAALTTARKVQLGATKAHVALSLSDAFELDGVSAVTIKADVTPSMGLMLFFR